MLIDRLFIRFGGDATQRIIVEAEGDLTRTSLGLYLWSELAFLRAAPQGE